MRVCCLGDIHYDGDSSDLDRLAKGIAEECEDVDTVAIVGDLTSSGRLGYAEEVLKVIRRALWDVGLPGAPVLAVPGNHDIYLTREELNAGISSIAKLSRFNEIVERLGCVALMDKPFILGEVGFVGSIGWYDYSFAPEWLNLPIESYREKAFGLSVWADREFVRLPLSDEEFTLMLLENFEEHIKEIYDSVDRIVVLHHVPFRELVHYRLVPEWDYFSAFMGSESFGYVIKKYKSKIRLVLYGHSHDGVDTGFCREVEGINCCNCASPVPVLVRV